MLWRVVFWLAVAGLNWTLPSFGICIDEEAEVVACPEAPTAEEIAAWNLVSYASLGMAAWVNVLYWRRWGQAPD